MRVQRKIGFCLVTVVAVGVFVRAQQPQTPMFRSSTELVDLYVTVTDDNGRLVPNLAQDDFAIFDDQVPQEIVLFENDVRPITVVVMLDTSASLTPSLELLKAGAEQFLIRMLPDDQGRVGAFNDKIEIEPATFIGDRDRLIDVLGELDFGNPTRLYDAIAASLDALQDIEGRRVVLVFTDGDDTDSDLGWRAVLERAVVEEVMIYAIGLESNYFNGVRQVRSRPDRNLKRFAEETGGGYFELKETDELGPTFTRVAQELHSQYVLGFSPTTRDGRLHSLKVRLKRPGMTSRARRSYIAPIDAPASEAVNP
jgi:Ca-activated chloride channel family protein